MQSSPVEATLRILMNSVPFLMGAAADLTGELIASAVAGESAYAMAFAPPASTAGEHVSVMRVPAAAARTPVAAGVAPSRAPAPEPAAPEPPRKAATSDLVFDQV